MNIICIQGRLTKDAELRQTQTGKTACIFTIANNTGYGDNKHTNFINCIAWGKTAEFIVKWFDKGSMIAISGMLQVSQYDGKNGEKKTKTEVIVKDVYFCDEKKKTQDNRFENFTQLEEDVALPWEV